MKVPVMVAGRRVPSTLASSHRNVPSLVCITKRNGPLNQKQKVCPVPKSHFSPSPSFPPLLIETYYGAVGERSAPLRSHVLKCRRGNVIYLAGLFHLNEDRCGVTKQTR